MIFEIVSSGRRYLYMRAASAREPFERNLARYFGTSCDPDAVARLSPVDQHGVQRGRAMPGMTKDGVIFAIGYPAEHDTPDLTADVWTYWKNRHQSFEVQFADGVVTRIKE